MADAVRPRPALDEQRIAVALEYVLPRTSATSKAGCGRVPRRPLRDRADGATSRRASAVRQMLRAPSGHYEAVAVYFGDPGLMVQTRTTGVRAGGMPIDITSVKMFGFDKDRLVLDRASSTR